MTKATLSNIVINARAIASLDADVATRGAAALEGFRAEFASVDVPTFKAKRTEWVTAYDAARGSASGDKRFPEVMRAAGVTKPQSPNAAKKQAARKASGAGKAGTAADKRTKGAKEGSGASAAKAVQMQLSAIEAHLIGLIRAKKFAMATECVAAIAAKVD